MCFPIIKDKSNISDDICEFITADYKFKNSKELQPENSFSNLSTLDILKLDISKYFKVFTTCKNSIKFSYF